MSTSARPHALRRLVATTAVALSTATALAAPASAAGVRPSAWAPTGLRTATHARPSGLTGADQRRVARVRGQLARLRQCESGGDYSIDTGNGFYGAYQFNLDTWRGLGYRGLPSDATAAVQDAAAARLQAARGWEPWPACSAALGL